MDPAATFSGYCDVALDALKSMRNSPFSNCSDISSTSIDTLDNTSVGVETAIGNKGRKKKKKRPRKKKHSAKVLRRKKRRQLASTLAAIRQYQSEVYDRPELSRPPLPQPQEFMDLSQRENGFRNDNWVPHPFYSPPRMFQNRGTPYQRRRSYADDNYPPSYRERDMESFSDNRHGERHNFKRNKFYSQPNDKRKNVLKNTQIVPKQAVYVTKSCESRDKKASEKKDDDDGKDESDDKSDKDANKIKDDIRGAKSVLQKSEKNKKEVVNDSNKFIISADSWNVVQKLSNRDGNNANDGNKMRISAEKCDITTNKHDSINDNSSNLIVCTISTSKPTVDTDGLSTLEDENSAVVEKHSSSLIVPIPKIKCGFATRDSSSSPLNDNETNSHSPVGNKTSTSPLPSKSPEHLPSEELHTRVPLPLSADKYNEDDSVIDADSDEGTICYDDFISISNIDTTHSYFHAKTFADCEHVDLNVPSPINKAAKAGRTQSPAEENDCSDCRVLDMEIDTPSPKFETLEQNTIKKRRENGLYNDINSDQLLDQLNGVFKDGENTTYCNNSKNRTKSLEETIEKNTNEKSMPKSKSLDSISKRDDVNIDLKTNLLILLGNHNTKSTHGTDELLKAIGESDTGKQSGKKRKSSSSFDKIKSSNSSNPTYLKKAHTSLSNEKTATQRSIKANKEACIPNKIFKSRREVSSDINDNHLKKWQPRDGKREDETCVKNQEITKPSELKRQKSCVDKKCEAVCPSLVGYTIPKKITARRNTFSDTNELYLKTMDSLFAIDVDSGPEVISNTTFQKVKTAQFAKPGKNKAGKKRHRERDDTEPKLKKTNRGKVKKSIEPKNSNIKKLPINRDIDENSKKIKLSDKEKLKSSGCDSKVAKQQVFYKLGDKVLKTLENVPARWKEKNSEKQKGNYSKPNASIVEKTVRENDKQLGGEKREPSSDNRPPRKKDNSSRKNADKHSKISSASIQKSVSHKHNSCADKSLKETVNKRKKIVHRKTFSETRRRSVNDMELKGPKSVRNDTEVTSPVLKFATTSVTDTELIKCAQLPAYVYPVPKRNRCYSITSNIRRDRAVILGDPDIKEMNSIETKQNDSSDDVIELVPDIPFVDLTNDVCVVQEEVKLKKEEELDLLANINTDVGKGGEQITLYRSDETLDHSLEIQATSASIAPNKRNETETASIDMISVGKVKADSADTANQSAETNVEIARADNINSSDQASDIVPSRSKSEYQLIVDPSTNIHKESIESESVGKDSPDIPKQSAETARAGDQTPDILPSGSQSIRIVSMQTIIESSTSALASVSVSNATTASSQIIADQSTEETVALYPPNVAIETADSSNSDKPINQMAALEKLIEEALDKQMGTHVPIYASALQARASRQLMTASVEQDTGTRNLPNMRLPPPPPPTYEVHMQNTRYTEPAPTSRMNVGVQPVHLSPVPEPPNTTDNPEMSRRMTENLERTLCNNQLNSVRGIFVKYLVFIVEIAKARNTYIGELKNVKNLPELVKMEIASFHEYFLARHYTICRAMVLDLQTLTLFTDLNCAMSEFLWCILAETRKAEPQLSQSQFIILLAHLIKPQKAYYESVPFLRLLLRYVSITFNEICRLIAPAGNSAALVTMSSAQLMMLKRQILQYNDICLKQRRIPTSHNKNINATNNQNLNSAGPQNILESYLRNQGPSETAVNGTKSCTSNVNHRKQAGPSPRISIPQPGSLINFKLRSPTNPSTNLPSRLPAQVPAAPNSQRYTFAATSTLNNLHSYRPLGHNPSVYRKPAYQPAPFNAQVNISTRKATSDVPNSEAYNSTAHVPASFTNRANVFARRTSISDPAIPNSTAYNSSKHIPANISTRTSVTCTAVLKSAVDNSSAHIPANISTRRTSVTCTAVPNSTAYNSSPHIPANIPARRASVTCTAVPNFAIENSTAHVPASFTNRANVFARRTSISDPAIPNSTAYNSSQYIPANIPARRTSVTCTAVPNFAVENSSLHIPANSPATRTAVTSTAVPHSAVYSASAQVPASCKTLTSVSSRRTSISEAAAPVSAAYCFSARINAPYNAPAGKIATSNCVVNSPPYGSLAYTGLAQIPAQSSAETPHSTSCSTLAAASSQHTQYNPQSSENTASASNLAVANSLVHPVPYTSPTIPTPSDVHSSPGHATQGPKPLARVSTTSPQTASVFKFPARMTNSPVPKTLANNSPEVRSPAEGQSPGGSSTTDPLPTLISLLKSPVYAPRLSGSPIYEQYSPETVTGKETASVPAGPSSSDRDDENYIETIDLTWIEDIDPEQLRNEMEFLVVKEEPEDENDKDENIHRDQSAVANKHSVLNYQGRKCICDKPACYLCDCKNAMYCSVLCQNKDWRSHKTFCLKYKGKNK